MLSTAVDRFYRLGSDITLCILFAACCQQLLTGFAGQEGGEPLRPNHEAQGVGLWALRTEVRFLDLRIVQQLSPRP